MRVPGCLMLALALVLAAALARAQDGGECPHLKGWRPSPKELETMLRAHEEWYYDKEGWKNPGVPGRAILCNADLREADLQDADLKGANLAGADLWVANLAGADLRGADFAGANLDGANLAGAVLGGADFTGAILMWADLTEASLLGTNLTRADLQGTNFAGATLTAANLSFAQLDLTNLDGAKLSYATLLGAHYAPATAPAQGYLVELSGLKTVRFPPGQGSGLAQLRDRLAAAGLRDLERQATYALERQITRHKFGEWTERPLRNLGVGVEGAIRWILFELPVAYGLYPGRALLFLLGSIGAFALVYLVPLSKAGTGGIHRVWPEGRLEARSSTAELVGQAKVERLRPRGWRGLKRLGRALQFSVLSAFHLGWRELNVGNWIARVQAHEYTLRATGWVRVVAGVQSLISVYLLAIWPEFAVGGERAGFRA